MVEEKVPKEIKVFACELCNITTNSEANLQDHLQGTRHMKKFMNQGNNPTADGTAITNTSAVTTTPKSNGNQVTPPAATAKNPLDLKNIKDPVVGLQYIVEQESNSAVSKEFRCQLCKAVVNSGSLAPHLLGFKHRMAYLEKHSPEEYDLLSGLPKSEQTVALQRMVQDAAKKYGRGKIKYLPQNAQKRTLPHNETGSGKRMKTEFGNNLSDDVFGLNRGAFGDYKRNNYERPNYNERQYLESYGEGQGQDQGHPFDHRGVQNYDNSYMGQDEWNVRGGHREEPRSDRYSHPSVSHEMSRPGMCGPIPPDYPTEKLVSLVERKFRLPDGSLGALLPVVSNGVVMNGAQAQAALDISNGLTQALLKYRKQKSQQEEMLLNAEHFAGTADNLSSGHNGFRRAAANNASLSLSQSAYNMHTGYSTKGLYQRRLQPESMENFVASQQQNQYRMHQQEQQYEYEGQERQEGQQQGYSQYDLGQERREPYQLSQQKPPQRQYQRQQMPEQERQSFAARSSQLYSRF